MKHIFVSLLISSLIFGCKFGSDEKVETEEVSTPEVNQSIAPTPEESVSPFADDPVAKEWTDLWKEKDQFKALKAFKKKHGAFLQTNEKLGDLSTLFADGACGETYLSLVKDAGEISETVVEINEKGKILNTWNSGVDAENLLRAEGDSLFVKVVFPENLEEIETSKNHEYVLKISKNSQFEILESNEKTTKKWTIDNIDCPKNLTTNPTTNIA